MTFNIICTALAAHQSKTFHKTKLWQQTEEEGIIHNYELLHAFVD